MEHLEESANGQEAVADFKLLNEKLRGRAESELMSKEQEVETEFGRKNLETLLEGLIKGYL